MKVAEARDIEVRTEHLRLNTNFPEASQAPGIERATQDDIRRKRLIYRSKQRGWLEVSAGNSTSERRAVLFSLLIMAAGCLA